MPFTSATAGSYRLTITSFSNVRTATICTEKHHESGAKVTPPRCRVLVDLLRRDSLAESRPNTCGGVLFKCERAPADGSMVGVLDFDVQRRLHSVLRRARS